MRPRNGDRDSEWPRAVGPVPLATTGRRVDSVWLSIAQELSREPLAWVWAQPLGAGGREWAVRLCPGLCPGYAGNARCSSIFSPSFFLGFLFSFLLILPFSSLSLHLLFPTLIFPFLFQVFLAPLFHLCNPPLVIVKCNLLDAFFCDRISSGLRRFCPHRLRCCSSSAVLRHFSHEPQLDLGLHIVAADAHTHGWRF